MPNSEFREFETKKKGVFRVTLLFTCLRVKNKYHCQDVDSGFQASARAAVAGMRGSLEECVIVRIIFIHDGRGLITLLITHILLLNMQSFGMRMRKGCCAKDVQ
jgi:hypothetical protein